MTTRDWLMVFGLGIGWGTAFIANAILLRDVGPLGVSFLRIFTGAIAVWIVLMVARNRARLSRRDLGNLALFGIITYAFPFTLFPAAQTYLAAGITGVINAMTPILVVVVSHFWPGGEKASPNKVAGVVVGFSGIVILAWPTLQEGGQSAAWAVFLALLAPLCYAIGFNLVRRIIHLNKGMMTAVALSFAATAVLPVMLVTDGLPYPLGHQSLLALAIIGPVLTGFAFLLMNQLVVRVGATNASTVTFIAPISAVVLGILLLGEELSLVQLVGMGVIFAGLLTLDGRLLVQLRRYSQPKG